MYVTGIEQKQLYGYGYFEKWKIECLIALVTVKANFYFIFSIFTRIIVRNHGKITEIALFSFYYVFTL